jgi:phage tail-like protein
MADIYPPVSFYFEVRIAGIQTTGDSSFLEAEGLNVEREYETLKEGGENRFPHRVPGRLKFQNLVLKRGLMGTQSLLALWCMEALESDLGTPFGIMDIDVRLLNEKGSPLAVWNFKRAWPVKWSMDAFNATENKLAIEKLEFAYSYFERTK